MTQRARRFQSALERRIAKEVRKLKKTLPFPYDLERLIDDWVFMAFLLGNDFIPHIPNSHIHAESLLTVWDTYQVVLPILDGYLVEFGYLNLPRFHKYLEELSQFERDWFEEREAAFQWMRGKQGARMANELEKLGLSSEDNQASSHKTVFSTGKCTSLDKKNDLDEMTDFIDLFTPRSECQYDNVILDEAAELMEEGVVLCHKNNSSNQFPNNNNTHDVMEDNHHQEDDVYDEAETELEEGNENVSDIETDTDLYKDILVYRMHRRDYYSSKLGIQPDDISSDHDSQPVLPFVRQLMILPSDSAHIVPKPYWELMVSPSSPLAKFFPKEFETDINGKIASWEAVVLIPFSDQEFLINAMKDGNGKLTEQEKQRNQHKSHLFYRACVIGRVKSPVELITYDFYRTSVNYSESQLSQFYTSVTRSVVDDFPSLLSLPFTHKIQRIPVYVFERPSKSDSLALTMKPHSEFSKYDSLSQLAENILGRPFRVRWPFCATLMPVRMMNNSEIWELVDFNIEPIIKSSSDLPSESLRSRPLLSSEESHELKWINSQLSSLKHYFNTMD
ncbi:unnamed protein product [Schistosoma turkestanicum]|nr:unnamed protein product [Schistosoma turkestanicum]